VKRTVCLDEFGEWCQDLPFVIMGFLSFVYIWRTPFTILQLYKVNQREFDVF